MPRLGALRLLPVERRVRLPRPVAGRAGAHVHAAGPHPRAPPARGRAPVRGGGRAALVERPGRPGHPDALLGRSSLAPLRDGRVRQDHGGPRRPRRAGALPGGASRSARRARGVRDPGHLPRDGHAVRARRQGRGSRAHRRRARPAAHRELRLERRLQPRRPRGPRGERLGRLVPPRRPGSVRPVVRGAGRCAQSGALPRRARAPGDHAGASLGRRVVPARVLRRRHAARFVPERRGEDRLDRPDLGRSLGRRAEKALRARDDVRAHPPGPARLGRHPAPGAAVRSHGPRPGVHQGLHPGDPRERRAVHARGGVGRPRARASRQRRRGGGAVPHAQPHQPLADGERGRAGT